MNHIAGAVPGYPLTRLMHPIPTSGKIAVDETVAPVTDPGRGRTKGILLGHSHVDDRPLGRTAPRPRSGPGPGDRNPLSPLNV